MTKIVQEAPEHFEPVRHLTVEAFAHSDLGHNGEADLIDAIRHQCDDILSLVAVDDNRVVGHILFSPAVIRSASSTLHGMGLAPMAVLPTHQRRGIGSILVREGLRSLAKSDAAFALVVGHSEYYPRFGFIPARRLSVTHGFEGMPQDILFIHPFDDTLMNTMTGGLAYYHPTFGPQHSEAHAARVCSHR